MPLFLVTCWRYLFCVDSGCTPDLPRRTWRIPHAASSLSLFKPIYLFYAKRCERGVNRRTTDTLWPRQYASSDINARMYIGPDPPWNFDAYRASVSKYFSLFAGGGKAHRFRFAGEKFKCLWRWAAWNSLKFENKAWRISSIVWRKSEKRRLEIRKLVFGKFLRKKRGVRKPRFYFTDSKNRMNVLCHEKKNTRNLLLRTVP